MLYEIDQQDVVTKVDEAWNTFAQENRADHLVGAGVVGSSLWQHIQQPETKQLYKELQLPDDSWVEVEDAVRSLRLFDAALPELTHGICAHCFQQAALALPPERAAPI